LVAAPVSCRPKTDILIGHARAIPELLTTHTTHPVIFTMHFFVDAGHRATAIREESLRRSRVLAQIKVHSHVIVVERMGGRLATPRSITLYRAQIDSPYDDGITIRA